MLKYQHNYDLKEESMENEVEFNSDLLYEAAKDLFLEKGYKNTTFGDLAERVNVHKSLITYYFKTKYNLATLVIQEYVTSYTNAVVDTLKRFSKEDDPFYESVLRTMVLFNGLAHNKKMSDFYVEFIDAGGPRLYTSLKRTLLERIKDKFVLPFDEKNLKFIQMVDDASRTSLIRSYFGGCTDLTLDEAIEMKSKLMFRMFGFNETDIDRIYDESKYMFENTNYIFGPGMYIYVDKNNK